jgi:hypothetical protein
MIKKSVLIIVGSFFLITCSNSSNRNTQALEELPASNKPVRAEIIQDNLFNDLQMYMDSFYAGDADKAMEYIYPDYHTYLFNEHPEIYSVETSKEFMRDIIKSTKENLAKSGMSMEFKIGEISNKVEHRGDLLYEVTTSVIAKGKTEEHSFDGEVIGISSDSGKTWSFIQKDEETSQFILGIKYPKSVINQLIN